MRWFNKFRYSLFFAVIILLGAHGVGRGDGGLVTPTQLFNPDASSPLVWPNTSAGFWDSSTLSNWTRIFIPTYVLKPDNSISFQLGLPRINNPATYTTWSQVNNGTGYLPIAGFSPGDGATQSVSLLENITTSGIFAMSGTVTIAGFQSEKIQTNSDLYITSGAATFVEGVSPTIVHTPQLAPTLNLLVTVDHGAHKLFYNLGDDAILRLGASNIGTGKVTITGAPGAKVQLVTNSAFGTGQVYLQESVSLEATPLVGNTVTIANPITAETQYTYYLSTNNNRATLEVAGANNITFNGSLKAVGGLAPGVLPDDQLGLGLKLSGTGTVTLNAANNFTRPVTVASGTLALGHNSALDGTPALRLNGGAIQAVGGSRTVNIASGISVGGNFTVSGSNQLTLGGTINLLGATRTIDVTNTAATVFSGAITNGGITKAGAGILTLRGCEINGQGRRKCLYNVKDF